MPGGLRTGIRRADSVFYANTNSVQLPYFLSRKITYGSTRYGFAILRSHPVFEDYAFVRLNCPVHGPATLVS